MDTIGKYHLAETMRVEIHVRPGASRTRVGGEYDGALVVRVVQPPDAGRATEEALQAVAVALGLSNRAVRLVRGATSRRKLVEIEDGSDRDALALAVEQLKQSPSLD